MKGNWNRIQNQEKQVNKDKKESELISPVPKRVTIKILRMKTQMRTFNIQDQ